MALVPEVLPEREWRSEQKARMPERLPERLPEREGQPGRKALMREMRSDMVLERSVSS